MKKLKFVLLTLTLIVFLGFSLFFVPVEVKADDTDFWDAPMLAKVYVSPDGRGIRLYVDRIFGDDVSGEVEYVIMRCVKDYQIGDTVMGYQEEFAFGRNYFHSGLLGGKLRSVLQYWGENNPIPEYDRVYVYFDVNLQRFVTEWIGNGYWVYWIERSFDFLDDNESYNMGYNDGYDVGYDEGYDDGYYDGEGAGYDIGLEVGLEEGYWQGYHDGFPAGRDEGYQQGLMAGNEEAYEQGYNDGQKSKLAENNEKFYNGIEKWLVPAIIAVIVVGGFVSIAVKKRKEE
jgi:hypothetical protein